MLAGRQAGKKVVVIKQLDEGTKERPYPHAIVAGIERYPLKVTKRMGSKKLAKRSKVKPFIKVRGFDVCGDYTSVLNHNLEHCFSAYIRSSTTHIFSPHGTLLSSRVLRALSALRPSRSLHSERTRRSR